MKQLRGRRCRVGLLGMYTSRNLGDAAIVHEIMRNIAVRRPDCDFVAINHAPEDAVRLLGVESFPALGYGPAFHADGSPWSEMEHPPPRWLSRGLGTRRIVAAVRTLDFLVMTGGGQIEDFFGGATSQPRVLITWTALARLFRIPVAFLSVGVDQLLDRTSRLLALNAVRLAAMRSFRDAGSVELLREAGLGRDCRVDPDPALGLDAIPPGPASPGTEAVVVVSPISFRTFSRVRDPAYDTYLTALASACDRWAAKGLRIRFVCSDIAMDPPVVGEVLARVNPETRRRCDVADPRTYEQFVRSVAAGRFLVGSRLHALILAVAAGVPVVAISPARKVTRFMNDCGFADLCIDMSSVTADQLTALESRVEATQDRLRGRIAAIVETSRVQLSGAYDDLVRLIPGPFGGG